MTTTTAQGIDPATASWGAAAQERAAVAARGPFTDREQAHVDTYINRLCEDAAQDFTEHLQSLDDDAYRNAHTEFGGRRAKVHISNDLELLADWDQAWKALNAGLRALDDTSAPELSDAAVEFLSEEKARLDVVRDRVHQLALNHLLRKVRRTA